MKRTTTLAALFASAFFGLSACDDTDSFMPNEDAMDVPMDEGQDTDTADPGNPAPPALGAMIDRTGRPAVSTATVATFMADDDAKGDRKDAYNEASPADWSDFAADIAGSLAILDALDGTCGNQLGAADLNEDESVPADRYSTLASVLANDVLKVNSTRGTCGVYLGAEAEALGVVGEGEGGCGGRTPVDDVIERSYSVLAAGALAGVDDTITEDDGGANADTFPFLGAPSSPE